MTRRPPRPRARGAVLLMVLLITALATILASAILWRVDLWLNQVEIMHDARQAQRLALGGVDWARMLLRERDENGITVDYLGEPWSTRVPPIPVAGGEAGGQMFDEQARFNLGALRPEAPAEDVNWQSFGRLLDVLGLPPGLAAALRARMSEAGPRLRLTGVASLAGVPGYAPPVLARLRDFVTVLPPEPAAGQKPSAINVNTAPAEVLAAVTPGLTPAVARDLVAARAGRPFVSRRDFVNRLPQTLRDDVRYDAIAVRSDYFRVETFARFGRGRAVLSALLHRSPGHWPAIVWMRNP